MKQIIFIGLFIMTPFSYSEDAIDIQELEALGVKALKAGSGLIQRLAEV